jgi:hypothetical protein
MKREFDIRVISGTFHLLFDDSGSGVCTSDLHCPQEDHDVASWSRYEGAIDSLESFILAAALAGIVVESQAFKTVLQTTLDAIENNLD